MPADVDFGDINGLTQDAAGLFSNLGQIVLHQGGKDPAYTEQDGKNDNRYNRNPADTHIESSEYHPHGSERDDVKLFL